MELTDAENSLFPVMFESHLKEGYLSEKEFVCREEDFFFFLRYMDKDSYFLLRIFPQLYKEEQLLPPLVCFCGQQGLSKIGSTLKGKNLLLGEQIVFFKK